MPRSARIKSPTEIYHVMLRGINRQPIFLDDEDRRRFLWVLRQCQQISGFRLYGYCLMTNHIHLLIKAEGEPLETIFRRAGSRFVYWYNGKYQRIGHLFQDRYRSEPIKNEARFLTVLRYILQNPMKAGIEQRVGQYRWSSYGAYAGLDDALTDTDPARGLFSSDREMLDFFAKRNDDTAMDVHDEAIRITDEAAAVVFCDVTQCKTAEDFLALDKQQRIKHLRILRGKGLSLNQIASLTGLPKSTVDRLAK